MSKVLYEAFLPEVLPYVRDCPETMALNAVRAACIEFCKDSLALREVLEPITIVADQSEYELDKRAYYNVAKIIRMYHGIRELPGRSIEQLDAMLGGKWRTESGSPMYYTQESENTFRVVLTPSQASNDTLNVTVALTPKRDSDYVDGYIFERWAEVIAMGARARLHDTPKQPFSDKEAALRFRKWFESGRGEAKIEVNRGLTRGPLRVRYNSLV